MVVVVVVVVVVVIVTDGVLGYLCSVNSDQLTSAALADF